MSSIWNPKWNVIDIKSRENAVNMIGSTLKMRDVIEWDYKDNLLDTISKNELQEKMIALYDKLKPQIIYSPSPFDFNFEHKLAFEIVEMSSKSYYSSYIEKIITYEVPSSTDHSLNPATQFHPNYFCDITKNIDKKIELIKYYSTELYKHPHPRSEEYVRSLAKVRGGQCGIKYAEAFNIIKCIE